MSPKTKPGTESPPKPPIAPTGDTLELAEAMLRGMLALVSTALATGDLDPDVAKQAPNIARAVAAVAGERRQIVKLEMKRAEQLGMPQVLSFLRQLPPEKRTNVIRELESMQRGGSVLG